ncbi:hypothetical protein [Phycicoccus flavus]|uniref:hypothetical protein n=1 Tax=Phycicoccus flavus TaxID=2502783 RepID=UPI001F35E4B6|nr:hypothetical protein [Phycicoccus flavus]
MTLAEERAHPRRTRRGIAVLTVLALGAAGVAGYVGVQRLVHAVSGEQCRVTAAGSEYRWAPDQASNAAAITAISVKRGLPARAASIAIATAMQESKVRNVRFGDRDSLGLFQQRPSQGWGTAQQILDPEYSTNTFYDALEKVDGYADMDIAEAAQAVQRSAAGSAYAQHEGQARATASVLSGQTHAGVGCALRDPSSPGSPQDVVALLEKDFGLEGTVSGDSVVVTPESTDLAWAVASWAVARATDTGAMQVQVDLRRWTRSMEDSAFTWSTVRLGPTEDAPDPNQVRISLARPS